MRTRILGSYAEILSRRGAPQFVIAAFLGRLSRSTTSIATVLLVSAVTGSYSIAGGVSGSVIVGVALSGPLWSRAIDSRGQARVVPVSLVATVIAAVALALAVTLEAPVWTWFVAAFVVGAGSLDFGTLARARWSALLERPDQRHTSLALESVADELVYIIGPPSVTFLAALAGPLWGFGAGFAATVLGGILLLLQRRTAPPIRAADATRPRRARGLRGWLPAGVLAALPIYGGIGFLFASIDVGAVSVARAAGSSILAGIIVASFSIGSVIAAILFGPLSAKFAAPRRMLVSSLAFALIVPVVLIAREAPVLAVLLFFAGLATSPVLISALSLIESRTERHRLTEALTWPSIGLSVGLTLGAAISGIVIDAGTPYSGFVVAAAGAAIVGVFGIIGALAGRETSAIAHSPV